MTDLRTAAQQALEALDAATSCIDGYYVPRGKTTLPEIEEAQKALRAALAQQDEPVAWIDALKDAFFEGFTSVATYNDTLLNSPEEAWENYKPPRAAPPQRKPLTEEVATLIAQRDALLEALKDATKTIEHLGYPLAAIERARAAIKAVEETK